MVRTWVIHTVYPLGWCGYCSSLSLISHCQYSSVWSGINTEIYNLWIGRYYQKHRGSNNMACSSQAWMHQGWGRQESAYKDHTEKVTTDGPTIIIRWYLTQVSVGSQACVWRPSELEKPLYWTNVNSFFPSIFREWFNCFLDVMKQKEYLAVSPTWCLNCCYSSQFRPAWGLRFIDCCHCAAAWACT